MLMMSEIKYQCSWENNYKMSYKNKIHCNKFDFGTKATHK